MNCSKCGASLPTDANYCFLCGKTVDASDVKPVAFRFFNMTASLSRRTMLVRTNHKDFADTVYADLERVLTRNKESISRRTEGADSIVSYAAVTEGYDDLQMSRFAQHWKDACEREGWQAQKCHSRGDYDVCFSYARKD